MIKRVNQGWVRSVFFAILCLAALFPITGEAVSRRRVVRDFKKGYKVPKHRKILKIRYTGKKRRFWKWVGGRKRRHKSYIVKVDNLFKECGLKVRYTWGVWYAKMGRRWIYQKNVIRGHKKLNKPTKGANITDAQISRILKDNLKSSASWSYHVVKAKVLEKKLKKWEFCTPHFWMKARIQLLGGSRSATHATLYSCKIEATITEVNGKMGYTDLKCYDKNGKLRSYCQYSNMCKKIGKRLNAPAPPSWSSKVARKIRSFAVNHFTDRSTFRKLKLEKIEYTDKSADVRSHEGEVLADWKAKVTFVLPDADNYAWNYNRSLPKKVKGRFVCRIRASKRSSSGKWYWRTSLGCGGFGKDKSNYRACARLYESCACVGPNKAYCNFLRKQKKGPCGGRSCGFKTTDHTAGTALRHAAISKIRRTKMLMCRSKRFRSGNSMSSLTSWGKRYLKKAFKATDPKISAHLRGVDNAILTACPKAINYLGAAHCKNPRNRTARQLLRKTLIQCTKLYNHGVKKFCKNPGSNCRHVKKELRQIKSSLNRK
jgi:hypothetical protein